MIKLIIFDLDNTLFDTRGQLGMKALDKMISEMKKVGLTPEQERILREKYHATGFRILAKQLGFSENLLRIGLDTYKHLDLAGITPFPDVHVLQELSQEKVLVTSGLKHVQMKKVEILGLMHLFKEVIVDDSNNLSNKERIFDKLVRKHKLSQREVMVVGDNAESEIAAGHNLGMVVVQIFRRDFIKGKADYYVKDLYEVKSIIQRMKA
jgi:FMN phosphatase YigB (HAD superfamily)